MREKWSFSVKKNHSLEKFLNDNGVKYKIVGDGVTVPLMLTFSVFRDSPVCSQIGKYTSAKPIITTEYSRSEINHASYLSFLPVKNSITVTNVEEAFQFSCKRKTLFGEDRYNHKKQIGPLQIKSIPKMDSTMFFSSSTGYSEIFGNSLFYDVARNNHITGVIFLPVYCGKNGQQLDNMFQLTAEHVLPTDCIIVNNPSDIKKCPICGMQKIVCSQSYQLFLRKHESELTQDFYMTEAVFGEGFSYPLYIISSRLFLLIQETRMNKNIKVEPVRFIDA